MKTQKSAVCLIVMLTLSACNSNAKPEVVSDSVRLSGNERCLDLERMMNQFAALPGNQSIQTQVTNIEVLSGSTAPEFELSAIRAFYESDTVPQAKNYDGSKTAQTGCESFKITYKNGRSDDYKITAYTEESMTLALQGSYEENLEFHRVSDQTYEIQFSTTLGTCDNSNAGTVQVSETVSWANPLPTVSVSPDFMAKVQQAQSTPQPTCFNQK